MCSSDLLTRIRLMIGLVVAITVLRVAAISASVVSAQNAHAARSHHHKRHHRACHIPQHNGGDRDSDNRGGPSDGDGCM